MPGKLRQRRRGGEGVPADRPQTSILPLLEAAALASGLPRPFDLGRELLAAGYFDLSLLNQWHLVQDLLFEHAQDLADPWPAVEGLGFHPEARIRFFAPGVLARLFQDRPEEAIRRLRPWARDSDFRVAEAIQAFGLRPQAQALGPATVKHLMPWTDDPSPYVRRAAVEALRPRGVWVKRIPWTVEAPAKLLPLLEKLRYEDHRYVANAIGNTLNDISKDHPRLALEVVGRWMQEADDAPLMERISRKGLRTLLKDGDPFALRLFGFAELDLKVKARLLNGKEVPPNTTLEFELEIDNRGSGGPANLIYELETQGRNPSRPRRKRYQGGTLDLPAGACLIIALRERIFDRRATPLLDGPAKARFFLNGEAVACAEFAIRRSKAAASGRSRKPRGGSGSKTTG
ncbi:MAG: hypothetical protein DWQ01_21735 [Planctomycetota bacterium]|nr:MAG: hypothetical protein DWQ01_21735 [Planctomycetota bacterium]